MSLAHRLLPALQITRMALVFTAISDAQTSLLLRSAYQAQLMGGKSSWRSFVDLRQMLAIAIISTGLYGFGMALNDIIDRRRDRQLAAHRPLPSGRIGLFGAYFICISLGLAAGIAGVYFWRGPSGDDLGLALLVGTGMLIVFYDYAGKYLVALGLLTLGLIRFFHALVPAARIPLVWHPLLLLDHVTILSAVAYYWEQKRPTLTRLHCWIVAGGLALMNAMAIGSVAWRGAHQSHTPGLWLRWELLLPLGAMVAFAALAAILRRRTPNPRIAGQAAMMWGLLWLIVYDALFVGGYVSWTAAAFIALLLPVAYAAVYLMRLWSKLLLMSQRPDYRRAER